MNYTLHRHLVALSVGYKFSISEDERLLYVHNLALPRGYSQRFTELLIEIPSDYPTSPPGVASRIYAPPHLRFRGRRLRDLHPSTNPGWGNWAWLCYEYIRWDPMRDNLIRLLEMIRADLADPRTEGD